MNNRCPLFAELCAGTAAVSLRLHGGSKARPPVWDPRDMTGVDKMKVVDVKAAIPTWTEAQIVSALLEEGARSTTRKSVVTMLRAAQGWTPWSRSSRG